MCNKNGNFGRRFAWLSMNFCRKQNTKREYVRNRNKDRQERRNIKTLNVHLRMKSRKLKPTGAKIN